MISTKYFIKKCPKNKRVIVRVKDAHRYVISQKKVMLRYVKIILIILLLLFSDILHYIAENLNIEDLVDIIPKDYDDAERYFSLAQNNAQANHLKTLIMITGKQLLASM